MAPETPKGVSSRLLTMKFMQRAAATESAAASPDSATSSASKKRKLDHSPAQGRLSVNFDQASVQAALAEQEAQRQSALNRHSSGDTHWVLNRSASKPKAAKKAASKPKIVYVGYGDIDSGNESSDHEDAAQKGRTATTNYKQSKSKKAKTEADDDGEDDEDSASSDDEDRARSSYRHNQDADKMARNTSRNSSRSRSQSRQSSESARAKEFRDKRKKKEVRLSKPTSISSGGQKGFGGASAGMTCYNCHGSGHKSADCPKKSSRGSKSK